MWGQIAAFAAPKVLNFLKGKAQDKVMGAVDNRLQGGGGGSSFSVDQSGGGAGGVDFGSGNARYQSSRLMDPESRGIRQEALNQLRGMSGNLEGNLAAARGAYDTAKAQATDAVAKSGFGQAATRGQFGQNMADANFINTEAQIRAADQAQQLERARLMGTLGVEGAGQVDYGRETSPWEKMLGGFTTGLGLYNQLSPNKGLFERLGLTRGEGDDSSMPGGGAADQGGAGGGASNQINRTPLGQTLSDQLSFRTTPLGQDLHSGLSRSLREVTPEVEAARSMPTLYESMQTNRSLPRMRTKGFNFMKPMPMNSLRNPRYN